MTLVHGLLGLFSFLVLVSGPVPLGLALARFVNPNDRTWSAQSALILLTVWLIVHGWIGLILGMLYKLTLAWTILAESFFFVAGIIVLTRIRGSRSSTSYAKQRKEPQRSSFHISLIAATFAVTGGILLGIAAIRPIAEYDSLAYHLPTMARWVEDGGFSTLEQFGEDPLSRYPYTWEAICVLFMMPFRGDFGIVLPNLVAWVLLGLSVYLLGDRLGLETTARAIAAALLMAMPMVWGQVNTMHVDLPLAAVFLVGLHFAWAFHDTRQPAHLGLFIATLGLQVGIKSSGVFYALPAILVLTAAEVRLRLCRGRASARGGPGTKSMLPWMLLGVLSAVVLGGYWYWRNLRASGNPFGLVEIRAAGKTIFPGTYSFAEIRRTTLMGVFNLSNPSHWRILAEQFYRRLYVPFGVLALGFVLSVAMALSGRSRVKPARILFFVLLLAGTALLYWATPFSADNGGNKYQITPWMGNQIRFAFPFLGLFAVMAALGIDRVGAPRSVLAILTAVSVAFGLGQGEVSHVTAALIAVLALAFMFYSLWETFSCTRRRTVIGALAILLVLGIPLARRERERNVRAFYGPVVDYVENQVAETETVGYLLSHRSYLFYGRNLDRKVVYIPIESADLAGWLETIRQKGVDVIAAGPIEPNWEQGNAPEWLNNPQGPFDKVCGEDVAREPLLYRLRAAH